MSKTIQIRDVPDDVHRRLTERAADERKSLSELLRADIIDIARRPRAVEMLRRLADRPVTHIEETAAAALADERR